MVSFGAKDSGKGIHKCSSTAPVEKILTRLDQCYATTMVENLLTCPGRDNPDRL
jgi:hypothetical protein